VSSRAGGSRAGGYVLDQRIGFSHNAIGITAVWTVRLWAPKAPQAANRRRESEGIAMAPLTLEQLEALGRLGTCAVTNAIETFGLRLRNAGFANSAVHCCFEDLPPVVGYAVTARIRTAVPPMLGPTYVDRTDWWATLLDVPPPRIVVLEDADVRPGLGALVGEVHANILRALGCRGLVTNGAVRDLPQLHALGFQCFACHATPSHAYAHIFEFGTGVDVGGLRIEPGELLHGDRHGLVKIPLQIASAIPGVAAAMAADERPLIQLCQSPDFSLDKLRALLPSQLPPDEHDIITE
jgi:4-hydroxy-4-methyl-2-oxoglutarate aldolase